MKHDIRDLYDPNGPHVDILASILEGRPPRFPTGEAKPGFDCLIVVLRRIYSHVMLGTHLDWLADSEKENPILRLAWHTFDDGDEEVEHAIRIRQNVLNAFPSMGLEPGASFEELCNSSLMNKTFWSQDEFQLTDIPYCMETFQPVGGSPDEIAGASLLVLDCDQNPGLLLQEVVDKSFGIITKKDKQVMCRPNNPAVVRVLYKTNEDDMRRPDINGFRNLYVPQWEQDMDSDDACFQEVGRAEYCLLAVVLLRERGGEKVRTYGIQGSDIVAEREPRDIMDDQWSLKFRGKYMLFYGPQTMDHPGDPTRFPEVTGPMISDDDANLLKKVDENLKSARLSLKNPERAGPSAQEAPEAASAVESPKVAHGQTSAPSTGQAEPDESGAEPGRQKRKTPPDSQEGSFRKSKRPRRGKAGASNGSSQSGGRDQSERPQGSSSRQHESERRRDARRSPPRR
jgi:hypothetical protein